MERSFAPAKPFVAKEWRSGLMRAEVAIVGAGPAGIFAARAAARKAQVLVLDDNIRPGGQIWRRNPFLTTLPGNGAFPIYRTNAFVVDAIGKDRLTAVACQIGEKKYQVDCDIAAVGYGLVPNNELAAVLGCETRDRYVVVDNEQRTTVNNVFGAGEITGIGGVEKSMIEGEIAGLRSTGQPADHCWRRRNRKWQFVKLLEKSFRLSPALKNLATDDTILCRCEDLSFGEVNRYKNWRLAKLQRRIGMGPCQGRVCGPAFSFLCGSGIPGSERVSVRPPVFATHLENLISKEKL